MFARRARGTGLRVLLVEAWMAVLLTSSEFGHKFYARADASGARGFVSKSDLAQIEFEAFWPREDQE